MNLDQIKARLSTYEVVEFAGPASAGVIEDAEKALGVSLPPQYRSFLVEWGSGGVDCEEFVGLGGADHLNFVKLTKRLRERSNGLPDFLLPLRHDGFGNYDCLDVTQRLEDGEYAIVLWNHDAGSDQYCEMLAGSFWEWMDSVLDLIESNA